MAGETLLDDDGYTMLDDDGYTRLLNDNDDCPACCNPCVICEDLPDELVVTGDSATPGAFCFTLQDGADSPLAFELNKSFPCGALETADPERCCYVRDFPAAELWNATTAGKVLNYVSSGSLVHMNVGGGVYKWRLRLRGYDGGIFANDTTVWLGERASTIDCIASPLGTYTQTGGCLTAPNTLTVS